MKRYEVIGLMWQRQSDGIHFSAQSSDGDITYFAVPALERLFLGMAAALRMPVGDVCDAVNRELTRMEREARIASGIPFVEWEFQLTPEQAEAWGEIFAQDGG